MLRDITLGQYFIGNSVIHRIDPRMKIILTIAFITMLFIIRSYIGFLITLIFVLSVIFLSKIPIKFVLKGVKPIIPLVIFTSILNMFFITGKPLVQFWIFKITDAGLELAILMSIRIVLLIMGTSMLTYTTSPIALTDAIERLLNPLKKIKFPAHEMAMMMTIALRFIPTLIEETDKIMSAQKARGADLESGNIMQRAKALIPILVPLIVSAFMRAGELAMAMECRCYQGGEGRTRMRQLRYTRLDLISALVMILIIVLLVIINIFVPANI